jgi:hypothetical protein
VTNLSTYLRKYEEIENPTITFFKVLLLHLSHFFSPPAAAAAAAAHIALHAGHEARFVHPLHITNSNFHMFRQQCYSY